MSAITEKINLLKQGIKSCLDNDVTHDELGTVNGFHEAQEAKQRTCDYLIHILNQSDAYADGINSVVLNEHLSNIENFIQQITNTANTINNIVNEGVHRDNFPSLRQKQINAMNSHESSFKQQLYAYEIDLTLKELQNKLTTDELSQQSAEESKKILEEIKETSQEAKKVLDIVQQKATKKGVETSITTFSKLKSTHSIYQIVWAVIFVLSFVSLSLIIYEIYKLEIPEPFDTNFYISIIKRILLLSLPIIALRVSLVKYNAERNLNIIYSHRQTVLNDYPNFEAGIGEDIAAKNQFRLEIAKYIFSDPKTGYTHSEGNTGTEINISPAMSAMDKLVGKS